MVVHSLKDGGNESSSSCRRGRHGNRDPRRRDHARRRDQISDGSMEPRLEERFHRADTEEVKELQAA
jgi:hypothetical protein